MGSKAYKDRKKDEKREGNSTRSMLSRKMEETRSHKKARKNIFFNGSKQIRRNKIGRNL
jgi:hypothetical protein